jgi:hypothetical protein
MVGSAAVWPARSVRRQAQDVDVETGPLPGVGVLGGERWLLVWGRDPLGECCCWRGTVRTGQGARAGNCTNPGKHPWVTRVDGQLYGFEHGAADALDWVDLADRYGPPGGRGSWPWCWTGSSWWTWTASARCGTSPGCRTPCPGRRSWGSPARRGASTSGWTPGLEPEGAEPVDGPVAGALGRLVTARTSAKRAGAGFLLDVRTGANRYVVWPGQDAAGASAGGSPGGTSGR